MFGKVQAERTVVGIATAPGIFQINEPITFGIPIVMNPTYMIPFVVGPTVLAGVSYLCMQFNIIERVCISVPWVTPPVINGILSNCRWFQRSNIPSDFYRILSNTMDSICNVIKQTKCLITI